MSYKVLTYEEKHTLLDFLKNEIKEVKNESVRDVYSIMLALLYENILLEHKVAVAASPPPAGGAPSVISVVQDVIAQFERARLPAIITQQYVTDFVELSENLAILSTTVVQLKELLLQAVASGDAYVKPEGLAFQ